MKRKWISILCLFLFNQVTFEVSACDVCGCSISGQQFGILPQFQKHFAGIRYSYKSFRSEHPPLFSTDIKHVSNEEFHTTDLWGRYVFSNRVQIFGFVPYQSITKIEDGDIFTQQGIGDVTLIGMYALINQKRSSDGRWVQHFQVGGGIKLPTGAHHYYNDEGDWIPGIQKGTGTSDILLNINYLLRHDNLGLSAEASWRINGKNAEQDFRYGQRLTSGLRSFYVVPIGDKSLMPSAGFLIEHSARDYHEGATVDLSGGTAIFGHMGVDFFSNGITVGLSVQPALSQNVANGNLTSGTRVNAQFAVLF